MLKCPKCKNVMEEVVYGRNIYVDRCTNCKGIWFDLGEVELLRGRWMSEVLDEGDAQVGAAFNYVKDVDCPRCHRRMTLKIDHDRPDIWYEVCESHGMYFDAGEFARSQRDQLLKQFRSFVSAGSPAVDDA